MGVTRGGREGRGNRIVRARVRDVLSTRAKGRGAVAARRRAHGLSVGLQGREKKGSRAKKVPNRTTATLNPSQGAARQKSQRGRDKKKKKPTRPIPTRASGLIVRALTTPAAASLATGASLVAAAEALRGATARPPRRRDAALGSACPPTPEAFGLVTCARLFARRTGGAWTRGTTAATAEERAAIFNYEREVSSLVMGRTPAASLRRRRRLAVSMK